MFYYFCNLGATLRHGGNISHVVLSVFSVKCTCPYILGSLIIDPPQLMKREVRSEMTGHGRVEVLPTVHLNRSYSCLPGRLLSVIQFPHRKIHQGELTRKGTTQKICHVYLPLHMLIVTKLSTRTGIKTHQVLPRHLLPSSPCTHSLHGTPTRPTLSCPGKRHSPRSHAASSTPWYSGRTGAAPCLCLFRLSSYIRAPRSSQRTGRQ
jgi:hypothetical protein